LIARDSSFLLSLLSSFSALRKSEVEGGRLAPRIDEALFPSLFSPSERAKAEIEPDTARRGSEGNSLFPFSFPLFVTAFYVEVRRE